MKQLFTFIIGMMGMSQVLQAQNVEFRNNGTPISAGETATFYASEDDWGSVSITTNPTDNSNDLRLFNLTDHEVNGKATMTMTENTLGTDDRQWCMGGACVSTSAASYVKDFSIPAGGSIQVQYDIEPVQFGEMTSELGMVPALVGFVAAFVTGCFACRFMIEIVRRQRLIWFAIYCAIIGSTAIIATVC